MKGRRRARRLALQALYELDQSIHSYDRVVMGRCQAILGEWFDRSGAQIRPASRTRLVEALRDVIEDPDPERIGEIDQPRERLRFLEALLAELFEGKAHAADRAVLGRRVEGLSDVTGQLAYAVRIVGGVADSTAEIDGVISRIAPEWPVDQMAPVDRNLLRIAIWEIGSAASPPRVAINEAVEMAREFSGESSRRMVNGALGAYTSDESKMLSFEAPDLTAS